MSKRETQVLQLIAMELNNEEISEQLFISKRTIETHRHNIINKLNVKNTAGLMKVALRMKLVED